MSTSANVAAWIWSGAANTGPATFGARLSEAKEREYADKFC